MNKGYIKLWRSEADIPKLWENAMLFATYQKLKMLADRTDGWAITAPVRKLAAQLSVSVGTLRKATDELAEIGLIRCDTDGDGVTRYELVFADAEPDLSQVSHQHRIPRAAKKNAAVSKNDTPLYQNLTQPVSKNDTTPVSKNDTPLYREQESIDNYKTTTPLLFPQAEQENDFMANFAKFWAAYPNKKSKQRAIKRWKKGNYNLAEILPVLEKQKQLRDWVKANGQFVPRADAYLNQHRWEDALPTGEEAYILNFKEPKTHRDEAATYWLLNISPGLLQNDNQKINSVFEYDRIFFEKIIATCGNDVHQAFNVMVHGWKTGCNTLRAISERAAAYLDELKNQEYKK